MSTPERPARPTTPGTLVRVRGSKYDGRAHWAFDGVWLGADEHGDWIGFPVGTHFERPGAAFTAAWPSLTLVTSTGWMPAFNLGHPRRLGTYVDLTTVPEWRADASGFTISYVDLDLDVVERDGEPAFIDDEDEFAEHAVEFGYPADLVERVRADADALLAAVQRRESPFDGATAAAWFDRLAAVG
ncbi:YgaC family protein [Agromyces endophyticus]|uniref:DUF402 domain-containing protein n=1 Tax=Agromyces sp. H17E-10 TaxID=2932244 RepID=UPI001FD5F03E|nr:DUF402 domain-containing protein [Agromyces sp. H17E-10]UOQ90655.1 YgaC family protein [Agromyces sp. H17E-10]